MPNYSAPTTSLRPVSRDDMRKKGMTKKTTNNLTSGNVGGTLSTRGFSEEKVSGSVSGSGSTRGFTSD